MNPKQKVLFSQLQISAAGLLIAGFGWVWKEPLLAGFGLLITMFGLVRLIILRRFVSEDSGIPEMLDLEAYLPDEQEREQEREDEWEAALEAWLHRSSKKPSVRSAFSEKIPEKRDGVSEEQESEKQKKEGIL